MPSDPVLTALAVGDEPAAWRDAGFAVESDGRCGLADVVVHLGAPGDEGGDGSGDGGGVRAWALDGAEAAVDGLAALDAPPGPVPVAPHPNGVVALDHLVVTTPDLGRSVDALVAAGLEPRRTREAGRVHQVFFRLGGPVLELVGPPEPAGDGPARFWGLALTVADLDATAHALGPQLGRVKDAVQPGRRIATLRREAGLRTPVAFLSPRPSPRPATSPART